MAIDNGKLTNYGIGWVTDMAPREISRAATYFGDARIERTASIIGDQRVRVYSGGSVGGLTLFIAAPKSDGEIVVAAVSNNDTLFPAFTLPVAAEFMKAFDQND